LARVVTPRLYNDFDPGWSKPALAATGKASVRRRKFPAEQAVWLVVGMGLFADRYPQTRVVCLLNLRNRLIADARFGAWSVGEQPLAEGLWDRVPDDSTRLK
jgi:hypothetical protein